MRLLLLPPDERPIHVRLPALLADVAGVEVVLPPPEARPHYRTPADLAALATWVRDTAPTVDVAILSLEALCLGGLVPSRLHHEPLAEAVSRLQVVRDVAAGTKAPRLDLAGIVMRLPDLDDADEEPAYWADHGQDLAALARTLHARSTGRADDEAVAAATAGVPGAVVLDAFGRRLRNHGLLLAALELLADGTLDRLVLSSDDTAPEGLPAFEGALVDHWVRGLQLGDRVDRYPGADEVASVRLARWARGAEEAPTFALLPVDGLDRVAPYEDRPIAETARGQVRAVGGQLVDALDDAAIVLAVLPPQDLGDWALAPPASDVAAGTLEPFVDRVTELIEDGRWVAVADCSSPNGGSPGLLRGLVERGVASRLGAFAAWNTAGNTLGTAVAQAVLGRGRGGPGTPHERLLLHRMLEDVGFMSHERQHLRERRRTANLPPEPTAEEMPTERAKLHARLVPRLADLGEAAARWRLAEDSVDLPWRRTFHVDFSLVAVDDAPVPDRPGARTEVTRAVR